MWTDKKLLTRHERYKMDNFKDTFVRCAPYIGGSLLGAGVVAYIWKRSQPTKAERICGRFYPRKTVIVHQAPKGKYVPSLGHFVVKLETYLRIAKIPYQPCYDKTIAGPRGKIPWIEYNGLVMSDSQLIINYLNKEFNIDLNRHLSPKDKATAWAIQKWMEEFIYWLNIYTRWCIKLDDMVGVYTPNSAFYKEANKDKIRKRVSNAAYAQGVARHTDQEVGVMMSHDLEMLSKILDKKKFFMGDMPTELDCAAFGQLAQIRWATPDTCLGKTLMKAKLVNLLDYCERIKDLYWPDWNERIVGDRE